VIRPKPKSLQLFLAAPEFPIGRAAEPKKSATFSGRARIPYWSRGRTEKVCNFFWPRQNSLLVARPNRKSLQLFLAALS